VRKKFGMCCRDNIKSESKVNRSRHPPIDLEPAVTWFRNPSRVLCVAPTPAVVSLTSLECEAATIAMPDSTSRHAYAEWALPLLVLWSHAYHDLVLSAIKLRAADHSLVLPRVLLHRFRFKQAPRPDGAYLSHTNDLVRAKVRA
jgi:hypothetical protein